ncbi:hypothetical protein LOTGIDRAFT_157115 [Lottia gigantea]|uniref:Major facilitator superfamily associated domain-containing protein n=1 Tax=Lottia gigantea TaxID=225164 RepID=V4CII9_LOTGI|nr:hypothetical protein LOTGIDRAFT_157115 [Lottia gigantea]ESP01980.1 hypothetical protein LOTGIDRAFT_157115 [Lottia gigantea]
MGRTHIPHIPTLTLIQLAISQTYLFLRTIAGDNFVRPFVGALADKYSRYKTLLLLTLLLFGCGYFSFMFIPARICVHQFTPKLLKLCGPDVCINFGLGAYVLRFVGHSFINSKWYIIPLELLHGVTYSLLWSSISSKVNLISPTGSHGTFQGITGAIYNDLGRGFGAILTGSLFQIYDARWVWRSYSASCLILLIIFNITDRVWPMQESYSTKEEVVKDSEATENMLERPTVVKHGELTTNSETL